MAVAVTVLIPAKIAEDAQTTQYTVPAGITTIIDKFTATNFSGSTATLSINLVSGLDTVGNKNLITKTKSLNAGEVYTFPEITGQALTQASYISTIASAPDSINIRSNGRQIS